MWEFTSIAALRVSTHSRPKAAGSLRLYKRALGYCFNTQPPEGGWLFTFLIHADITCFNTQPPEGGWSFS